MRTRKEADLCGIVPKNSGSRTRETSGPQDGEESENRRPVNRNDGEGRWITEVIEQVIGDKERVRMLQQRLTFEL